MRTQRSKDFGSSPEVDTDIKNKTNIEINMRTVKNQRRENGSKPAMKLFFIF
jgi:hypothetical protein